MNGLVHSRHGLEKKTGLDKPIGTNGGGLENRYTSHFCHQWLGLMIEAPQTRRLLLFLGPPHIGKAPRVGTGDGGGVFNARSLSRRHCHLTHGDLGEALGNRLLRCRYSLGLEGMEGHTTLGSTANS